VVPDGKVYTHLMSPEDRTISNGLTFQQKSMKLSIRKKILLYGQLNIRTVNLGRLKTRVSKTGLVEHLSNKVNINSFCLWPV